MEETHLLNNTVVFEVSQTKLVRSELENFYIHVILF